MGSGGGAGSKWGAMRGKKPILTKRETWGCHLYRSSETAGQGGEEAGRRVSGVCPWGCG